MSKSERHHWWPECVSRRWADDRGGVNWILPNGSERRAKPSAFGVIGNGHFIKLGPKAGESSPWDQNFENEFQNADAGFPATIEWLEGLKFEPRFGQPRSNRFVVQSTTDELFGQLIESLTSLAIRSPMTRSAVVSLAERLRGPLAEWERNRLIALNMRDMHRRAVVAFGTHGKATAILSPNREFIFGDGFYHNLTSPNMAPHAPRILASLTPRLTVLYTKPIQYTAEPRISTLVIDEKEAQALNEVGLTYASDMIFYCSDRPILTDNFRAGRHLHYTSGNVVDLIIDDMLRIPPRRSRDL